MYKLRWGLRLYDFCGKLPFGTTITYSPAEERGAWQWYVDRIKETPQVLEKIRQEVWETDEGDRFARHADDLGECPIESAEEDAEEG
jgi:hypothetical protein